MSDEITVAGLLTKRCTPCPPGTTPLAVASVRTVLRDLSGWELVETEISKSYKFANYYETIAFVNATAWISHREDHHPDLEVGFNKCRVRYSTHSIGGISENDLICAAKLEAMVGAVATLPAVKPPADSRRTSARRGS